MKAESFSVSVSSVLDAMKVLNMNICLSYSEFSYGILVGILASNLNKLSAFLIKFRQNIHIQPYQ